MKRKSFSNLSNLKKTSILISCYKYTIQLLAEIKLSQQSKNLFHAHSRCFFLSPLCVLYVAGNVNALQYIQP